MGVLVAEQAGQKAADGVDQNHGRKFAAGQDIFADGNFLVNAEVDDSLVDAFVTAANQNKAGRVSEAGGQAFDAGVGESFAFRAEVNDWAVIFFADGFYGVDQWLWGHDHAGSSAVWDVVDFAPFVVGEVAQVVDVNFDDFSFKTFPDHAFAKVRLKNFRKNGDDVESDGFLLGHK